MSARLLAPFCLLILAVPPGWTGSHPASNSNLVLYLKTAATPVGAVAAMRTHLSALMGAAGYLVEWRDERTADRNVENGEMVVVELRGACGVPLGTARDGSLASTAVSDGRVLPFSWVNCDAVNRMLGPQPDFVLGRAMARLLAHELYHVLARSRQHGRSGLTKASFTRQDLLGEWPVR